MHGTGKSKYAKQNNNCKWDKKEMICANPDPAFVQPVPLTACTGPCCNLNWRACKGEPAPSLRSHLVPFSYFARSAVLGSEAEEER